MEKTFSSVKVRKSSLIKEVDIFTASGFSIKEAVVTRWQNSIDLIARLTGVPAVLIMRLHEENIEVFLSSRSPGNPYRQGATDHLLEGFYCETVIGTGSRLTVNNALDTSEWKDNPDVNLDMISYLGYPLKWPGGEFFGTVCLLDKQPRDFDENAEQLLASLQQSIEADLALLSTQISLSESEAKYKALNDDKDRFFSILAHDLRSPFTTLLGLTEMLQDQLLEADPESNLELVKTIYGAANGVFTLLENLLDWSRLQRNNLSFSPGETDFSVLSGYVFNHLESSVATKELTFNNQVEKGSTVFADRYMLSSILRNLLSNAIKFTERGGTITLSTSNTEGQFIFNVEDTGTGIDSDKLKKIFTLDCRGSMGTEGEPSSGLGLMIVKDFVEKHGGTVTVASTVNKGTTFTVKLPLNR